MPAGNFGGYFTKAADLLKNGRQAIRGRTASQVVSGARSTFRSSGAVKAVSGNKTAQKVMGTRVVKTAMKHPYRTGAAGVAGAGAASYISGGSRRGRGVDKMPGRPTGMYKY